MESNTSYVVSRDEPVANSSGLLGGAGQQSHHSPISNLLHLVKSMRGLVERVNAISLVWAHILCSQET
jgi:hypothetical protein